ncbi:hypothetical protein [Streptomyces sp. NBC_01262]|uniref:hypothetical protein n=1 Tax=Streptomyces sp. NBC_01262 TaxID=2903803 RepID=UPI003FCE6A31
MCADFAYERVEFHGENNHVHLLVDCPPKAALSKPAAPSRASARAGSAWGHLPAEGWGRFLPHWDRSAGRCRTSSSPCRGPSSHPGRTCPSTTPSARPPSKRTKPWTMGPRVLARRPNRSPSHTCSRRWRPRQPTPAAARPPAGHV